MSEEITGKKLINDICNCKIFTNITIRTGSGKHGTTPATTYTHKLFEINESPRGIRFFKIITGDLFMNEIYPEFLKDFVDLVIPNTAQKDKR